MKKLCVSFALAALALNAFSQPASTKVEGLGSNTAATRTFDNRNIDIKGSPYWVEDFKPGQMTTRRGTVLEDLNLRLDVYQNELHMRKSDDREIVIDKKTVHEFTIRNGSETSTFRNVVGKYLEIVHDGPITVLAEKRKKFESASLGDHYSQQDYDEYTNLDDVLYIQIKGGDLIEVKKNKKEFIKTFPVHQNEVKVLIDRDKLKPHRQEDLLKIINYCIKLES